MAKPLFKDKDNWTLIDILRKIFDNNAVRKDKGDVTEIYSEMAEHEIRLSSTSQIKRLNRMDLIQILYAILMPEIKRIDEASVDELPLLLNENWTVPQLKERLLDRFRSTNTEQRE